MGLDIKNNHIVSMKHIKYEGRKIEIVKRISFKWNLDAHKWPDLRTHKIGGGGKVYIIMLLIQILLETQLS